MVRFSKFLVVSAVAAAHPHGGKHADIAKELKLLQTEIKAQQAEIKDIKQASQKTSKLLLNLGKTFNEVPSFIEKTTALPPNCYIMTATNDAGQAVKDSVATAHYNNEVTDSGGNAVRPYNGAIRCTMFDATEANVPKDFENPGERAINPDDCPVRLCYKYGWETKSSSAAGTPSTVDLLLDTKNQLSVYTGPVVPGAEWDGNPWDDGKGLLGWDKDDAGLAPKQSEIGMTLGTGDTYGSPKGDPRIIGFHSTGDTGQVINFTDWIKQGIDNTAQNAGMDHRRAKFDDGEYATDMDAEVKKGIRQMWHTRCQAVAGYMDEDTVENGAPKYGDAAAPYQPLGGAGDEQEFYNGRGAAGSPSRCLCCLDNSFTDEELGDGTPIGDQAGGVY